MNHKIKKINQICNLIFAITAFSTVISFNNLVSAQITPDNTLPNNSEVGIEGNITKINGGTKRGSNLFHSFEKFGIPTGTEAHFNNAVDIQNIFTRVTGKSYSDIDGLIKANGAANLFLINPNGILFNRNARLDIGGSFVGSTAESLIFPNNLEFSAVNPDSKPLLSVNVPLGLQYGTNPQTIVNQSIAKNSQGDLIGLEIKPDKTLGLIGGDVVFNGGAASAKGGRIELGGVNNQGLVELNGDGNNLDNLSFDFPLDVERSDVSINGSIIFNGEIAVNSKNFELARNSFINTISDININSNETINLKDKSFITTVTTPQTSKQGGNISLITNNLVVKDGAVVSTGTSSEANGGDINVNAKNIELIGESQDGSIFSSFFTQTDSESTGNGGDILINTNNLVIKDGALISNNSSGQGNAGNLTVNANNIQLIGTAKNGQSNSQLSTLASDSTGDAGEIRINTNSLLIEDGASLISAALGKGNGSNLIVNTNSLLLKNGGNATSITSGSGKGGNLIVNAQDIQLIGDTKDSPINSSLTTLTDSALTGDAGEIRIKTDSLVLTNGAAIESLTLGTGKGGNLTIDARNIQLSGKNSNDMPSQFITSALFETIIDSGEIRINTDSLILKDGALIISSNSGNGNGGNIAIDADDIKFLEDSNLFASTLEDSTGNAGNVEIKTDSLILTNGSQINSSTSGQGNGGNLTVDARNIQLSGTTTDGLFPSVLISSAQEGARGTAGNLNIKTDNLQIQNGAGVSVDSLGTGIAGNLNITSNSVELDEGSIQAVTFSNNGGNINLDIADLLLMRNASKITATAGLQNAGGNGGNININAPNGFIVAAPNQNSDITANAFEGVGGKVKIDAAGIFGMVSRSREDLVDLLGTDNPIQLDSRELRTNDITAISQQNPDSNGTVEVIIPQTDPTSGSIELPTIQTDTEIVNACATPGYAQSSFTITGKGSLPPSPLKPLTGRINQTKLATLDEFEETKFQPRRINKKPEIKQIVEATGWIKNKNGEIFLVANPPQNRNIQTSKKLNNCS
ncbi:MAG: filamentous hemagglutinin N-terminal domain-containing protein [Cyanobacteria bacterium J06621_15]